MRLAAFAGRFLLLAASLAACAGPGAPGARTPPVRRIGLLLPSAGTWKSVGAEARRGAELCAEDPDVARPVRIEVVFREEREGEDPSPALARLADGDGVLAVVGPLLSSTAERALPAAAARSLALVSPTACSLRPGAGSPVFFRTCLTMEEFAAALAGRVSRGGRAPRLALFHPEEPYGRSFADAARRALALSGARVVASAVYGQGGRGLASQRARLGPLFGPRPGAPAGERPVDALFFAGTPADARAALEELAAAGGAVRGLPLVGGSAFDRPDLARVLGPWAEGTLFADGFFAGSILAGPAAFVRRYRARFGAEPGAAAAQACAAVQVLAGALGGGAATRAGVLAELGRGGAVPTAVGDVGVRPRGGLERAPFFAGVRDGALVELPPLPGPGAP